MGSLSDYSENELMDHIFNAAYTSVSTIYMALCTADPTDSGTGATISEVANANNYSRTAIAFSAASSRKVIQNGVVTFPQASGAWGTITHWCILDGNTHGAGNMLAHGAFGSSFAPVNGNTPSIADTLVEVEFIATTPSGAGFTDYGAHSLLDLMFGDILFYVPATYVVLTTAIINDQDVAVGDITEMTGTDYARELVDINGGSSPTWDLSTGGNVDNTDIITIGPPGADDWGEITSMCIMNSLSGSGNVICYDNDNIVDQTPTSSDTIQFAAGALDITLT